MYILDWITCCCYMMLRKIHYTKTGAETSAVANTCVIAGLWFITITNMFLWIISPTTLQWIYHKSNVYSITMMAIALAFIYLRYYYLRKNAISLMAKVILMSSLSSLFKSFVFLKPASAFLGFPKTP